jgi:hypothetical protein
MRTAVLPVTAFANDTVFEYQHCPHHGIWGHKTGSGFCQLQASVHVWLVGYRQW